jgi:PiT family inorganic phosphate transporter
LIRHVVRDRHLYEPPNGDQPPAGWVRWLLILTCTSVSFSHGTNDGQKSIGLIMLTIIGMMPAVYALNPQASDQIRQLGTLAGQAAPLIEKYGSDQKQLALQAAHQLQQSAPALMSADANGSALGLARAGQAHAAKANAQPSSRGPDAFRSAVRNDVYRLVAELKTVAKNPEADAAAKAQAKHLGGALRPTVEYAPWWVRILSALMLGLGTMVGYRRIVRTLGERVGNTHLTPAQGASGAEVVGAGLIASAGFTGLPVSTTHIVTSGIAGTMIGSGSGINPGMFWRIILAWVLTLPITIAAAAGLSFVPNQ